MFSLVNAAKDEDPKLAGLLPYYEERERVDELVEVVEGVEDLGKVKIEQVKELNGQGNVRNRNGNVGDEAFREMLGMRLWITTRKVVHIRTF